MHTHLGVVIYRLLGLARLVAASYDEDSYGVVQKDIPKVLESMLELLMTLESFLLAEAGSAKFRSNPYSARINAQRLTITRSYAMLQGMMRSFVSCLFLKMVSCVFKTDKGWFYIFMLKQ